MIEPAVVEASATGWLFAAAEVKSVSVGVPEISNSSACIPPAPVLAKVSPDVSVTVTWTSPVPMSVAVTVPNGPVPQVPLQKSDVREAVSVAADAEVSRPPVDALKRTEQPNNPIALLSRVRMRRGPYFARLNTRLHQPHELLR
jgi:hypothetical protein